MFGWCLVVVTELRMVQNFFSRLLAINTAKQKIILKNEMCLIAISPLYTYLFKIPYLGNHPMDVKAFYLGVRILPCVILFTYTVITACVIKASTSEPY